MDFEILTSQMNFKHSFLIKEEAKLPQMQTGPNNNSAHSSNLDLPGPISITSFDFPADNQFNPSEPNQSTVSFPSFISSTSVQQYPSQEPLKLTLQLSQQPLNQIANITAQRGLFNTPSQNELMIKNIEPLIASKSNSKTSKQQGYSTNSQSSHKSHSFSNTESRISLTSQSHNLAVAPLSSSPSISKYIHDNLPVSNESHPLLTSFQLGNNNQSVNRKALNNSTESQSHTLALSSNSAINNNNNTIFDSISPYKRNTKNRPYKAFKFDWLVAFNWLFYHDRVMYCLYCLKSKKSNIFTEGTTQFKKDSLSRHHNSSSHRRATEEFNKVKHNELSPEDRFTYTKFQLLPSSDGQPYPCPAKYIQALPFKPMPRPKISNQMNFQEKCMSIEQETSDPNQLHIPTLSLSNQSISNSSKVTDSFFKSNDINTSSIIPFPNHSSKKLSEMNMSLRNQLPTSENNQNGPTWSDFLVMNATFIAKHNLPLNLYEPLTNHILNMIDTFGYRKDSFDPPDRSKPSSNSKQ